jgi:glycosyltransferase involved in cell wall biosynthesis
MPHGPAYHFSPNEKPDIFWEKSDGSWLGFWPREWPDLLGEAVLEVTEQYDWEVWQPDSRADQVYSKALSTGIRHLLFPAIEKVYRPGVRTVTGIYSAEMISRLKDLAGSRFILQLHGFRIPFYHEILKALTPVKKFPILIIGHGTLITPVGEILCLHRPLTYLCLAVEHMRLMNILRHVDLISAPVTSSLKELRKVYNGRTKKLTMGCDFEFWIPVPSLAAKQSIRHKLNIDPRKTVFLTTGNFVSEKQFDKLIQTFSTLIARDDFFLIIAGHGDRANTDKLATLIDKLSKESKALLHHYVTGEELRDLYWASDLYVSSSSTEGSSVAIMKAMACGLPILSTLVGETTEVMQKYGAGRFLPVTNYIEWSKVIIDILERGMPPVLDIKIAKEAYDWSNVAKRFINLYDELLYPFRERM